MWDFLAEISFFLSMVLLYFQYNRSLPYLFKMSSFKFKTKVAVKVWILFNNFWFWIVTMWTSPRLTPDQPYGRNLPPSQLLADRKKSPAMIMKAQTTTLTTFRTLLKPTEFFTPRAMITVTSRAMNRASRSGYVSSPLPETQEENEWLSGSDPTLFLGPQQTPALLMSCSHWPSPLSVPRCVIM